MKRTVLVLFAFNIAIMSFAQSKNFIDQPYLETSALVDSLVVPDEIHLSILISELDTKGKTSVEELENKMAATLKELGIDIDKQLALTDLSSNFKKYFLKQKDVHKTKSYDLLVYDGLTAGMVIQALEKINISNVGIAKIAYSKMEQLQLELKSKAILKAKSNATYLANPLGQKVGNAIHISDQFRNYSYANVQNTNLKIRGMSAMEDSEAPLDIDFEKIKVTSSVAVKFALE